jgi:replicative DNA helicase
MNTPLRTEIERRALSCLFKDSSEVLAAIASGLKAEHFGDPANRAIFLSCVSAANSAPDTPPIETVMASAFAGAGSPSELMAIESLEVTTYKRVKLVDNVMALSKSDRAMALLIETLAEVKEADACDWESVWSVISPKLTEISALTAEKQTATFAQLCDSYIAEQRNPAAVRTVSLGLPTWDAKASPVRSHEMIALAGRPGAGKTALALQMAREVAKTATVAIFSLEMAGIELVARLAVHEAGRDGVGSHPTEINARIKAIEAIRGIPTMKVFEDPYVTVEEIEARCRLLAADKGGLGLVVIDYLQLIEVSPDMKKSPREQQVAQMSRRLKLMPKRIGCPVLVLCQLNRESEKENRPPRKSDLRESGAIEQDADRIWLLFQKIDDGEGVPNENTIVLLQDKCRAGPASVGTLLHFDRPCFKFSPLNQSHDSN